MANSIVSTNTYDFQPSPFPTFSILYPKNQTFGFLVHLGATDGVYQSIIYITSYQSPTHVQLPYLDLNTSNDVLGHPNLLFIQYD